MDREQNSYLKDIDMSMLGKARMLANMVCRRFGFQIERTYVPFTTALYAPFQVALKSISERVDNPSFLQIGGYDGREGDPIFDHVTREQWAGLILEPNPEVFNRLEENYRKFKRIRPLPVAVSETNEDRPFFFIPKENQDGLPSWVDQLGSFDPTFIPRITGIPSVASRIRSLDVVCKTIETILNDEGFDKLDLLQVDVEGYDSEVIRMFNFTKFKPAVVRFEHRHLSLEKRCFCFERLSSNGYCVCNLVHDTCAFLPKALQC